MQDTVCAVICSAAPANFWVPHPKNSIMLDLRKERDAVGAPAIKQLRRLLFENSTASCISLKKQVIVLDLGVCYNKYRIRIQLFL